MVAEHKIRAKNANALFALTIHRGEGMCLLAMDWKNGEPPADFGGFAIEYRPPGGDRFFTVKNRLAFPGTPPPPAGSRAEVYPSTKAPFQMFRWVHFPRDPNIDGFYTYKVTPIFVNELGELSNGEAQQADIRLARETVPGVINVAFTRGFVSSQAFVESFQKHGDIDTLLPARAKQGLDFKPTHPKADEAYEWMGLEARRTILDLLRKADEQSAEVSVVAYDLNLPDMVGILESIARKGRLRIIIDDDGDHGEHDSGETAAAARLIASAGADKVKRQHMGKLQHNKMVIVKAPRFNKAIGGSTNFSWRGWMVQSNNAVIVEGKKAIEPFQKAFESYWKADDEDFTDSPSAVWNDLQLAGVDAKVTFSPHSAGNAVLKSIGDDMGTAKSSILYSLAFLSQTHGAVREAIQEATVNDGIFVYGISDKKTKIELLKPDGNPAPVFFASLSKNVPEPFKSEPTGGGGTRMHHKFVVIDFDKPSARVYLGSYNFSKTADRQNGENLFLIRDQRIATSYMIEALRIFDHYNFRVIAAQAKAKKEKLALKLPPKPGEDPWWKKFYTDPRKIKERVLFA